MVQWSQKLYKRATSNVNDYLSYSPFTYIHDIQVHFKKWWASHGIKPLLPNKISYFHTATFYTSFKLQHCQHEPRITYYSITILLIWLMKIMSFYSSLSLLPFFNLLNSESAEFFSTSCCVSKKWDGWQNLIQSSVYISACLCKATIHRGGHETPGFALCAS